MNDHRPEVADVFRTYEKNFFAKWAMCSAQQRKAFEAIRDCRTAALGGHVEYVLLDFLSSRAATNSKLQVWRPQILPALTIVSVPNILTAIQRQVSNPRNGPAWFNFRECSYACQ